MSEKLVAFIIYKYCTCYLNKTKYSLGT